MNKLILLLLILASFDVTKGQTLSDSLAAGNWLLKSGWFTSGNLQFIKTNIENSHLVFKFNKNGVIDYFGTIDNMTCPVGALIVEDGNWSLDGNILTLEMRGLKVSDFWYWWIIKYKAKITGGRLTLKVHDIIKKREISPTKSFEDLMN